MRKKMAAALFIFIVLAVVSVQIHSAELKTQNVILITADGLRIQELFGGLDSILLDNKDMSGIENEEQLKTKYWRQTPEQRREALMPFFWTTIAQQGVILGNQSLGSIVKVKNPHLFSYPGYAEILTGTPRPEIDSNDPIQNPHITVLDYAKKKLNLNEKQVAVFASWSVFNAIATHNKDSFIINAGFEALPDSVLTDSMKTINQQQFDLLTPWDTVRHDVVTAELSLAYLKEHQPRVLYVALGETDDWGHERRYDRVLDMAYYFDQYVKRVWQTVQSMDGYRDKTTLIMATDHGRGVKPEDWVHHNPKYPGSDDIWIAALGPDTQPNGVLKNTPDYFLANISATLLKFLGLDFKDYNPNAFGPVQEAFK